MKYRFALLAACLIAASGLAAFAGEIADLYAKAVKEGHVHPATEWSDFDDKVKTYGITEFGVERTECMGQCPVYGVSIKSDGTFRYHGESNVSRKGNYTGRIAPWEFGKLMEFIKESGYMDLQDSYAAGVTDLPTVYTTVVMDGKRKVISDYAGAGPAKLWAVEQLIDNVLINAEWDTPAATQRSPPGKTPTTSATSAP